MIFLDADNSVKKRELDTLYHSMGVDIVEYLNDKNVFEISLNPDGKLWIDTYDRGRYYTGKLFNARMAEQIIQQIAAITNQIVSEEKPSLAAELPDGSRFQGFLPRIVAAPAFVIRKHSLQIFTLDDYVTQKVLTVKQKNIILDKISNKKNIVVGGGTKTGKTTFLNAILAEVSKLNERIVTIEDTPELKCTAKDWLGLRTTKSCNQYFLLHETLRASPERIFVGEIRSEEALDLLDAWSTGHGGGGASVHSNSAAETLTRIQNMVGRVSVSPQQQTIVNAVNIVVYLKTHGFDKRYVEDIIEVDGYDEVKRKYLYHKID